MSTSTPVSPSSALAVSGGSALTDPGTEYNLDAFPTDRYNRLIPTQTIRVPSDLVVPVVQVVQLDPDPRRGDVYTSRDIGSGNAALTRVGLRKVATAAAVSIVDVRRTDDASRPGECEVTATAEMVLPSGQRIRAVGTKRIVMDDQRWASPEQRAKFLSALQEHTAARAENRAIRALLSLRGSYPVDELRKPFAVVTFAPNMNHPEVRAQVIAAMTGTVSGAYGPQPARQVGPGLEPVALLEVPQAPDDDEAQYVEVRTNGHARVVVDTGEIVAERPADEPDWFDAAPAADPLVARLRRVADANRQLSGPASAVQKDALKGLLRGLTREQVGEVLAIAWDLGQLSAIEGRHAQAILEVGTAMGGEAFRQAWAQLAGEPGR